jgi:hypothetical protein
MQVYGADKVWRQLNREGVPMTPTKLLPPQPAFVPVPGVHETDHLPAPALGLGLIRSGMIKVE